MKEYIYLDNNQLNSILSQVDGGLLHRFSEGNSSGSSKKLNTEKAVSKGLDGVLQFGVKYVNEIKEGSDIELTKFQEKALEYALDDYAIDLLLDKIESYDNFTTNIEDAKEGYIVYFSSDFNLYDFELIQKLSEDKTVDIVFEDDDICEIKKQLKQYKSKAKNMPNSMKDEIAALEEKVKSYESTKNGFKLVNRIASLSNRLFNGDKILKTNQSISICRKENFRFSNSQLAFLPFSKRKVKLLGLVTSINNSFPEGDLNNFQTQELDKIPIMLYDAFLANFNLIEQNDRIIIPVAIFFE